MIYRLLKPLVIPAMVAMAASSYAQGATVYRCAGNVYTNDAAEAKTNNCKPVESANVTVIQGTRVNGNAGAPVKVATAPQASGAPNQRVDEAEQRNRDTQARAILEAELKKAETRQVELVKEFNNGEPEKMGPEHRNHQKYLDRVAELKANISRNESDIAGIRRELGRVK